MLRRIALPTATAIQFLELWESGTGVPHSETLARLLCTNELPVGFGFNSLPVRC